MSGVSFGARAAGTDPSVVLPARRMRRTGKWPTTQRFARFALRTGLAADHKLAVPPYRTTARLNAIWRDAESPPCGRFGGVECVEKGAVHELLR